MKTKMTVFILSFFVFSQAAFAGTWHHKLYRGIEGVITSPLEYVNQAQIASQNKSVIESTLSTIVGGTVMTVKRIVNGAYDIVTFPLPYPDSYRILLNDSSETAVDAYSSGQGKPTHPN